MNEEVLKKLEKNLKKVKIEGFIINQGNERIFEYLKSKKIKEKPTKVYSITKSIISMLIGILVEKKQLNIHTPIHHYFPEMGNSVTLQKKDITLFHLLTMTSGLKVVNFQASKNWVTSILNQPVINEPSSTFEYNSGNSHLLSAIIQKVSGETTASFAEENLFKPLGIHKYIWVADPQGIHGGGFSLSIHIEDMMKIGKVLLDEGVYMGKRVISPNWISESQTLYKQVSESEYGTYGYGYQFWIAKSSNHPNYFYANGIYGQNIFIVPKLNLVAAVKGQLDSKINHYPKAILRHFYGSV